MFVLAHLSDPHLGPVPTPYLGELTLKRTLGFANWRRRNLRHRADALDPLLRDLKSSGPDHIAVTGDLVNIAIEREFVAARRWLAQLGSPRDVTVIPGNHDAYVHAAVPYPVRHWGDFMHGDGDSAMAPPHFPFVRRRGDVVLVALSTALPTFPLLATGKLGEDQLTRCAGILTQLGHEGRFRIVLIHHPPASGPTQWLRRLVDAAPFRRAIADCGAELVLHGHTHVHSLTWLDGPSGKIPAVGVPSASATWSGHRDPAAYNLYRIERGQNRWRCEAISRGYRAGRSSIVETGRQTLAD